MTANDYPAVQYQYLMDPVLLCHSMKADIRWGQAEPSWIREEPSRLPLSPSFRTRSHYAAQATLDPTSHTPTSLYMLGF